MTLVPSVEKAFKILEFMASERQGHTISDVSRRFGLPISTTNNLLLTLVHCGYLRRNGKRSFRVTTKLLGEAAKVMENNPLRDLAHEELERLTNCTELASMLSMRDGDQVVCIDKVEGASQIRVASSIGKRFYLHSTPTGKAILAYAPESEVDATLARTGLPPVTPFTITSAEAFHAELKRVRMQGYAVDNEENTVGIRGVAASVFDHAGEVAGAISTGGVGFQLDDRMLSVIAAVRECARTVSAKLGFRVSPRSTSFP